MFLMSRRHAHYRSYKNPPWGLHPDTMSVCYYANQTRCPHLRSGLANDWLLPGVPLLCTAITALCGFSPWAGPWWVDLTRKPATIHINAGNLFQGTVLWLCFSSNLQPFNLWLSEWAVASSTQERFAKTLYFKIKNGLKTGPNIGMSNRLKLSINKDNF